MRRRGIRRFDRRKLAALSSVLGPIILCAVDFLRTAGGMLHYGQKVHSAFLAMKCPTLQKRVELDLFETARGPKTLFVPACHVMGGLFPLSLGLSTLEDDDIAWHGGVSVLK